MYLDLVELFLSVDVIDPDVAVVAMNTANNISSTCVITLDIRLAYV